MWTPNMSAQFPRLNPTLHQATRFTVLAFLIKAGGEASFVNVMNTAGIKNPGSLSTHARRLEEAGLLTFEKSFIDRKARTTLVITAKGRQAFAKHRFTLQAMSEPSAMAATA
jgi:DNA-binding MarR family transcriptional regulator